MRRLRIAALSAALSLSLALPVTAQETAPSPTPYPADHPRDCALVVGGQGSVFADPRVDGLWLQINRKVTENLVTDLRQNGYAVVTSFSEIADRASQPQKSLVELSRSGCALMIQVAHDVGENAQGRYFGFDVSVLRFVPNGERVPGVGTPVRTAGNFQKSWRYPRTPEEMDRFHVGAFANEVFGALMSAHAVDRAFDPDPDSAVVRDEYDRVAARNSQPEIHVRHILVADESTARAALARIRAGEPFGTVAAALSTDTGSAAQGGDLGWSKAAAYVPEFSSAALAQSPRGLDPEPVRSQFGWHVIELLDTHAARFPAFDDVKVKVAAQMKLVHDKALPAEAR